MSALNTEIYSTSDARFERELLQRELERLLAQDGAERMLTGGLRCSATDDDFTQVVHSPREAAVSEAASHIRIHIERISAKRELAAEEEALTRTQLLNEMRDRCASSRATLEAEEGANRRDTEAEEAAARRESRGVLVTLTKRLMEKDRMRQYVAQQAANHAAVAAHDAAIASELDSELLSEYAPYRGSHHVIQAHAARERVTYWDTLRRRQGIPLWERDLLGEGHSTTDGLESRQVDWHHPQAMRTQFVATSPYDARLTEAFTGE